MFRMFSRTGDSQSLGFSMRPFKIHGEKNLIAPTWVPLRSLEWSRFLPLPRPHCLILLCVTWSEVQNFVTYTQSQHEPTPMSGLCSEGEVL